MSFISVLKYYRCAKIICFVGLAKHIAKKRYLLQLKTQLEPKVVLILAPYLLESAADMVAIQIVVEGVFEFGYEVLPHSI